jgi:hypothetical protein
MTKRLLPRVALVATTGNDKAFARVCRRVPFGLPSAGFLAPLDSLRDGCALSQPENKRLRKIADPTPSGVDSIRFPAFLGS